jgi:predicted HTH transcriptional regulator
MAGFCFYIGRITKNYFVYESRANKTCTKRKENIHLGFKDAATALPGSLFETICAMLNRDGGDIILSVSDNGNVLGVDEIKLFRIIRLMRW